VVRLRLNFRLKRFTPFNAPPDAFPARAPIFAKFASPAGKKAAAPLIVLSLAARNRRTVK
jgi:hypothetical protein